MKKIWWKITVLSSLLGGAFVLLGIINAVSAIQEAASSAIGIAFSVIPYCIARAFSEIK